jgi:hypothetical protein
MPENTNQEAVSFGVGCFHFGVKRSPPFTLRNSEYLKELRNRLEGIPNIDHIIIDSYDDFEDSPIELDEPLTSIDESYEFFPPPASGLDIGFEIYIPHRIQNQLAPLGRKLFTCTERFRVYIRNPYFFPITFVEAIEPSGGCQPSDGVVVAREFLKKHFEESEPDGVGFDCLGPSPFHADFFLRAGMASEQGYDNNGFRCDPVYQRGYDRMDFFFDHSLYEDIDEARENLFYELEEEIGVFYRMIHLNVMRMRQWKHLQDLVDNLVSTYRAKGLRFLWNRAFRVHKQIWESVIAVAEFENHELWGDYDTQKSYHALTQTRREPYIDTHLKANMKNRPVYKCDQIQGLIQLLEARRSKAVEQAIVILSAILGGAVGAAITLLVAP